MAPSRVRCNGSGRSKRWTSSAGQAANESDCSTWRTRMATRSTFTRRCIVDDVWMTIGSDNLNLRSWTHDSELTCALLDPTVDERAPSDPANRGDGARRLPGGVRLRLWREHLG